MDMSFMTVFDLIIMVLGAYLLIIGIKCTMAKTVDPMIVTAEELTKCKDIAAMSAYLMPKTAIFGAFCIVFGLQGLSNDMGWINYPKYVNVIFLVAFVVCWIIYSYCIKTAKTTYISKF